MIIMAVRLFAFLVPSLFVTISCRTALAANANAKATAPSATEILANEDVQAALSQAWKDSFLEGSNSYQVRGGWIYADSNYPDSHKYFLVQHASKDRSTPATVRAVLKNAQSTEIELDNPETDKDGLPQSEHYKLVADFHTHPFAARELQRADSHDIKRAYERGVPGILLSCSGLFYYGPLHRDSLEGPTGYPLSSPESYNNQSDVKFSDNKFDVQHHCNP